MEDAVQTFYDRLAAGYDQLFGDWKQLTHRSGEVLGAFLAAQGKPAPAAVLDCTCGIGTQAIGLAAQGYAVHATDLSPAEVARALQEAEAFGVQMTSGVADVCALETQVPGLFDVVLSCDNALAHLLTEEDLQRAARNMRSKLPSGGLLLASVRDYNALGEDRPTFQSERLLDGPDGRRIVFQVWDWQTEAPVYVLNQFVLRQHGEEWWTDHYATPLRAWRRTEIGQAFGEVGIADVQWHMPAQSGYYQPIITGR